MSAAMAAPTTEEVPRMTAAPDPPAGGYAASNAVSIGGRDVIVERVSARKASAAFAILRAIGAAIPDLMGKVSRFRAEYAEREAVYVDRSEALYRMRDRVAHFTEADWEAVGGRIKLTSDASLGDVIMHVFPDAIEVAEEHVYRLLALVTMSNSDVKAFRRDGSLKDKLTERADDLVDDAGLEELLELAVVAGEVIDRQLRGKTEELGDRVGNALRLVGLDPTRLAPQTSPTPTQTTASPATSTTTPPSSTPTSSTDSAAPTNGAPTQPSTNPSTSSSPSSGESSASEPS